MLLDVLLCLMIGPKTFWMNLIPNIQFQEVYCYKLPVMTPNQDRFLAFSTWNTGNNIVTSAFQIILTQHGWQYLLLWCQGFFTIFKEGDPLCVLMLFDVMTQTCLLVQRARYLPQTAMCICILHKASSGLLKRMIQAVSQTGEQDTWYYQCNIVRSFRYSGGGIMFWTIIFLSDHTSLKGSHGETLDAVKYWDETRYVKLLMMILMMSSF